LCRRPDRGAANSIAVARERSRGRRIQPSSTPSGRKYVELWVSTHMGSQLFTERRGIAVAGFAIGGSLGLPAVAETPRPKSELPAPNVGRWTIRRKAAVVTAVANGVLTREEACQRYQLSEEEFASWQQAFEEHGLPGLRSTRLQQYRGRRPRD
jgi:hypothetical protein